MFTLATTSPSSREAGSVSIPCPGVLFRAVCTCFGAEPTRRANSSRAVSVASYDRGIPFRAQVSWQENRLQTRAAMLFATNDLLWLFTERICQRSERRNFENSIYRTRYRISEQIILNPIALKKVRATSIDSKTVHGVKYTLYLFFIVFFLIYTYI